MSSSSSRENGQTDCGKKWMKEIRSYTHGQEKTIVTIIKRQAQGGARHLTFSSFEREQRKRKDDTFFLTVSFHFIRSKKKEEKREK